MDGSTKNSVYKQGPECLYKILILNWKNGLINDSSSTSHGSNIITRISLPMEFEGQNKRT